MKLQNVAWITTASVVFVAGCGRGSTYKPKPEPKVEMAAVKEGADQNLTPFQVGNQWTYTAQVAQMVNGRSTIDPPAEQVFKITKVQKTPDGNLATFEVTINGAISSRLVWLANDKGIFQTAEGLDLKPITPPKPIIVFPAEKGKSFTWSGQSLMTDGKVGPTKIDNMILAPQEVDTEEGRLAAICVERKTTYSTAKGPTKGLASIWFAPGIGMALYTVETTTQKVMLKLKSHSLKQG